MSKKTVAIIQARMNSSRLPNKVLLHLAGKPVLEHICDRLNDVSSIDEIVIATTASASDSPIVEFSEENNINVYAHSGDENDLLGRYIACGHLYNADIIVMVDGDCPLLHPPTVERMVQILQQEPDGEYAQLDPCSIEGGVAVLRLYTFEKIARLTCETAHYEHATLFLMENPELFSIRQVSCEPEFIDIKHRLWLDTPADYLFLQEIYNTLYKPHNIIDLKMVVDWLKKDSTLRSINGHVLQKGVRSENDILQIDVTNVQDSDFESAKYFLSTLIERYQVPIRIQENFISDRQRQAWTKTLFTIVESESINTHPLLTLTSSSDFQIRKLSEGNKHPCVEIGIGNQPFSILRDRVTLLSCYLGYTETESGYFIPTTKSSLSADRVEKVNCPLCDSDQYETIWVHDKNTITNGICLSCGHVYVASRPTKQELKKIYATFAQNYPVAHLISESNQIWEVVDQRITYLDKYVKKINNVLEIGCGYGHLLSKFPSKNILKVGIEPSKHEVNFAREYFDIQECWLCDFEQMWHGSPTWPSNGFDLICSFHVIEHMAEPRRFIQFVSRWLSPNGYLCLAMPNLKTLSRDFIELGFLGNGLHLQSFTPETISLLLEWEGFEIVDIKNESLVSMLRSSFILIAKRKTDPETTIAQNHYDINCSIIKIFHQEMAYKLQFLSDTIAQWLLDGKNIAIYGGGVHTKSLLEFTNIDAEKIACIIDDDPAKQKQSIDGIPIKDYKNTIDNGIDIILISSLASEAKILERLRAELPSSIQAVGIYADLMDQV